MPALFLSLSFLIPAVVIFAILIGIFLEIEKEGWASTLACIFIVFLGVSHREHLWALVSTNPGEIAGIFFGYVALGIAWSVGKWTLFVKEVFENFTTFKKKLENSNKFKPEEIIKKLSAKFQPYGRDGATLESIVEEIKPEASDKKSLIVSWIAYWPISVLATLLNDPFRRFFEWVYENISGLYDKITESYKNKALKG